MTPPRDLARIRLDNALLLLFDEFVRQAARNPDAATLRGLEGRFAERLQIQPSYWSQIKSRARQIGERLARQFEQRIQAVRLDGSAARTRNRRRPKTTAQRRAATTSASSLAWC